MSDPVEVVEYTYEDVKTHNQKKDLWVVIDGHVYDISHFVDEHPGGEEVLLDVAGSDSTESFEDVGHSSEAREILAGLIKGKIKDGSLKPKAATLTTATTPNSSDGGIALYAAVVVGVGLAFGAYKYLQATTA